MIKVIAECADLIDYLSVHHYESPNRFAEGPAAAEKFWRQRAELIANSSNPKVKLYVSEWNAQSTDWRTGLYCGGILNVFERCSDFLDMGGPALFLRHSSAQRWDNAFINFDHRTWFPAPNYVVMKLWREHYAPNLVEMTGNLYGLNAVPTKSADGQHVYFKVVNPKDKLVDVRLVVEGGFKPAKASLKLVAPDSLMARNSLDKPDAVKAVSGQIRVEDNTVHFVLPRWSAGVVDLAK